MEKQQKEEEGSTVFEEYLDKKYVNLSGGSLSRATGDFLASDATTDAQIFINNLDMPEPDIEYYEPVVFE